MKPYQFLPLVVAIALLSGCKKDNPVSDPVRNIKLASGESYFWGNAADIWQDETLAGSHVLALDLYSERLSYNTTDQEYVGSGYNLYIENIFVEADNRVLVPGTYTMDAASGEPFTFAPGAWVSQIPYNAYLVTVTGTTISYELVTGDTFTVTAEGDSTFIDFALLREDGTALSGQFRGIIDAYDLTLGGQGDFSDEPQPASEQNWTLLYADTVICYGDYYGNGTDNIDLILSNNEVFAYLELNCPPLSGDSIPAGTYTLSPSHDEYTILASKGCFDSASGSYDSPSFVGLYEQNAGYVHAYYLVSGTLDVSRQGDRYTLTLDALSYYGSVIRATYSGALPVRPMAGKSVVAAGKTAVKVKSAYGQRRRSILHKQAIQDRKTP